MNDKKLFVGGYYSDLEMRKNIKDRKLFVGGYYDDRIFDEKFEGKTDFDKNIDTYTFDEVMKLSFVENVITDYEENSPNKITWDNLSLPHQIIKIVDYVATDEIAGLSYFTNEVDATNYKDAVIKEIKEIESETYFSHRQENSLGIFNEVWKVFDKDEIIIGKSILYKDWKFKIVSYHELYKQYYITITHDNKLIEGVFIETKYLTHDMFYNEIKRLYKVFKNDNHNSGNINIIIQLGNKVQLIPNTKLSDDYFGIAGQIVKCQQELEQKRVDGNLKFTGKIIERYQVEFDIDKTNKKIFEMYKNNRICKSLWLTQDMFKILHRNYIFKNLDLGEF